MIFYYDEQSLNGERMSVYYFVSKVYQSREVQASAVSAKRRTINFPPIISETRWR